MSDETHDMGAADDSAQPDDVKTEEQVWNEEAAKRMAGATSDTASEESQTDAEDAAPEDDDPDHSDKDKSGDDAEGSEVAEAQLAEERDRLKGTVNSQNRRITKQSKRIQELEDRLASFADRREEARKAPQSFDDLAKEYPELAGPIIEEMKLLRGDLDSVRGEVRTSSELHAERRRADVDAETARLDEMMPDWERTVTQHKAEFWRWVDDQSRADRELAKSSQSGIKDAEGIYDLISRFNKHRNGDDGVQREAEPASQKKTSRRLDGARTISTRGSQAQTTARAEDLDGPAAYAAAVKERAKTWGAV